MLKTTTLWQKFKVSHCNYNVLYLPYLSYVLLLSTLHRAESALVAPPQALVLLVVYIFASLCLSKELFVHLRLRLRVAFADRVALLAHARRQRHAVQGHRPARRVPKLPRLQLQRVRVVSPD